MKKLLSIFLVLTIMSSMVGVYAVPKSSAVDAIDGFLGVLNRAHTIVNETKLFSYVKFVDVNGDGIEEMIAIGKEDGFGPGVGCYLFSYTNDGIDDYNFGQCVYFHSGNFQTGGVEVYVNSGDFIIKDSVYAKGGASEYTEPQYVVYNELSVNDEGKIIQGIYRSYIETSGYEDLVYIEKTNESEKKKVVSKYEKGTKIPIYILGALDKYGCPELIVGDGFVSCQQAVDYLKQKKNETILASYSDFADITSSQSNEDKDKIAKLLSCFDVRERQIYALYSEDEIISFMYDILANPGTEKLITPVKTYSINAGGGIAVYNTSDIENFLFSLTGCRVDYKNHTCTDDNCKIKNQQIRTWEEVDAEVNEKVKNRDLIVIYTSECMGAEVEIKNILELSQDKLLVLYNYNTYDPIFTYAVVGRHIYNGQNEYYIIEQGGESTANADYIKKYVTISREPSNISIDYDKEYNEPNEYTEYIRTLVSGVIPNDSAKEDIAEYIEYAIKNSCKTVVNVKGKTVEITAEGISSELERAELFRNELLSVLSQNGISLNKPVEICLKLDTYGGNLKRGITVKFDKTLVDLADRFGSIKVVLDENKQGITINSSDIKYMLEKNYTSIQLRAKGNKYIIKFLDENGKETPKGAVQVTFSFKSNDEFNAVFFERDGQKDIWGGINDTKNKLIEFMTSLSGVYYVEKNEPDIKDIGELTPEEQDAVKFMVSRGYFNIEDGIFNPYGSLTRYDFTKILIGIFYAMDYNAQCTFTDVEKENPYYGYVASSQQEEIVKGFEDNTFKGNKNASNEEVISVSARTLANKKGYAYPVNVEEYIQFVDNEQISGWDNQYGEIALSVREGLIDKGGVLAPRANITRVDAAVILYRLFKLLYGDVPAEIETSSTTKDSYVVPILISGIGVLAVASGVTVFIIKKKKNIKK